jgi:hypothetical protein
LSIEKRGAQARAPFEPSAISTVKRETYALSQEETCQSFGSLRRGLPSLDKAQTAITFLAKHECPIKPIEIDQYLKHWSHWRSAIEPERSVWR